MDEANTEVGNSIPKSDEQSDDLSLPEENADKLRENSKIIGIPFKKGEDSRRNTKGRPFGKTAKERVKEKIAGMSDKELEEFLKEVPKELQWRMAEGNPAIDNNHTGQIIIKIEKEIAEQNNVDPITIDNSEGQA